MKSKKILFCTLPLLLFFLWPVVSLPLAAQTVEVNSANPSSAPQGTVNLDVTITGKGFKRGAVSRFYVTGTTNPGGIQVNSTNYRGPTELRANINVADDAQIANFDIEVQMADGRTGKGIELFSVVRKGSGQTCVTSPLPAGFTLITSLNPDPPAYTGEFGRGISVARVALVPTSPEAIVVTVKSRISGMVEVFVLDPATGQVLGGQPHVSLPSSTAPDAPSETHGVTQGDVNNDSIPDVIAGGGGLDEVLVYLGQVQGGMLSYQPAIRLVPPPNENAAGFGAGLAVGDVDGLVGNEVIVGAPDAAVGSVRDAGKVFVFKFDAASGFTFIRTLASPRPKAGDYFGGRIAVADVTGSPAMDVIVGAYDADVGNARDAGVVYVFPGPISAGTTPIELTRHIRGEGFGYRLATGDVDGDSKTDVVATLYLAEPALVFKGLVFAGQSPDISLLSDPAYDTIQGYGTNVSAGDINGDGLADVLIGAPNAADNSGSRGICSVGVAYAYLSGTSGPLTQRFALQPSPPTEGLLFGWSVATVPGSRLFLVGEPRRTVGSVSLAGQVYVFRRD